MPPTQQGGNRDIQSLRKFGLPVCVHSFQTIVLNNYSNVKKTNRIEENVPTKTKSPFAVDAQTRQDIDHHGASIPLPRKYKERENSSFYKLVTLGID